MNITVTGRHINVSQKLREYAEKKIKKLEKYFHQLIDAHIIMHVEKLDHISEVIINGDGIQFHGRENTTDFFSSIDLLFEKMEKQIVRYKEKHSSHKVVQPGKSIPFDFRSNEGKEIRLNQVSNKPINEIEAYLQMKADNGDFILFKKDLSKTDDICNLVNKCYAVIYREGDSLKMVDISFDKLKEQRFEQDTFTEYNLNVVEDSPTNPDIEFKKCPECNIQSLTLDDAIDKIEASGNTFMSFFNVESQYLNIIYQNGKNYEVMVPAY